MAKLSNSRLVFTQPFGPRAQQSSVDKSDYHWGGDYGPEVRNTKGVVLNALVSGRVTRIVDQYGALCIRIGTRATQAIELWHLERFLVADGVVVEAGVPVGVMGSTGRSTGIHVHVEHWVRGKRIDPKPFIDAQASKAVAPAPDDYYEEGFLMALSDDQQTQIDQKIELIFRALVKNPGTPQMYYAPDAIINVIRDEVKVDTKAVRDALLDSKKYGFAPVDIIVTHVTATLKALTAQAKEQGIDVSADEIVDELAKRLANG